MKGNGASGPVDLAPGWHWVYTRGYDLAVPAEHAFRWMVDHAPSEPSRPSTTDSSPNASGVRIERRAYQRGRILKVTRWEFLPPDRVTFYDEVYQRGHLVVQGEERYRFLGGDGAGCVVEVTALRKPAGWLSRIGFALFPGWSVRTRRQETELLDEIERDYRSGGSSPIQAGKTR